MRRTCGRRAEIVYSLYIIDCSLLVMAEKLFYTMGEVAEMFDVKPSLLRHWESQFSVIRPRRNKKGNRLFSPQDVENLKLIYHLVKERGMTLEGAKKALRVRKAGREVPRDAELMERLQRIRALLVEVREDLRQGEGQVVAVEDSAFEEAGGALADGYASVEGCASAEGAGSADGVFARAGADSVEACSVGSDEGAVAVAGADGAAAGEDPTPAASRARRRKAVVKIEPEGAARPEAKPAVRKPRRKKEEGETKELFAFYEQSLF